MLTFKPHIEGDLEPYYYLNYYPENDQPAPNTSFNLKREAIIEHFKIWIDLLKQYNAISFTEDSRILKQYENEYYESFHIDDTEAANDPLDEDKQINYYYALEGIVQGLKKAAPNDPDTLALVKETEALKNNIQNVSRRTFAIKTAKILAKIRKKG